MTIDRYYGLVIILLSCGLDVISRHAVCENLDTIMCWM